MKLTCQKSGHYGANRSRYNRGDVAEFGNTAYEARLIKAGQWALAAAPDIEPAGPVESPAVEQSAEAPAEPVAAVKPKKGAAKRDRAIEE